MGPVFLYFFQNFPNFSVDIYILGLKLTVYGLGPWFLSWV